MREWLINLYRYQLKFAVWNVTKSRIKISHPIRFISVYSIKIKYLCLNPAFTIQIILGMQVSNLLIALKDYPKLSYIRGDNRSSPESILFLLIKKVLKLANSTLNTAHSSEFISIVGVDE